MRRLRTATLLAVLSLVALALAACGDDDDDDGTPADGSPASSPADASPGASPVTPTPEPLPTTGVPEIDRVLAAISTYDGEKIDDLLQFTAIKCAADPQGLGAPPRCPEGVEDGTPIDAFLRATCEGIWQTEEFLAVIGQEIAQVAAQSELYAVVYAKEPDRSVDEGGFPPARYLAAFQSRTNPQTGWVAYIDEGIVAVVGGCQQDIPKWVEDNLDPAQGDGGYVRKPE
jgi:hypothetical protein